VVDGEGLGGGDTGERPLLYAPVCLLMIKNKKPGKTIKAPGSSPLRDQPLPCANIAALRVCSSHPLVFGVQC
jgi:hypothetical protein